jgi:antitoxin component YwqK of YwqJK toxin-antitoxin module
MRNNMVNMSEKITERSDRFADGSLRAQGQELGGELHGSWTWYRKDGTILRTGRFDRGRQVGIWGTYTADGTLHKETDFGT